MIPLIPSYFWYPGKIPVANWFSPVHQVCYSAIATYALLSGLCGYFVVRCFRWNYLMNFYQNFSHHLIMKLIPTCWSFKLAESNQFQLNIKSRIELMWDANTWLTTVSKTACTALNPCQIVVKSKLPPWSLETVEAHPRKGAIKFKLQRYWSQFLKLIVESWLWLGEYFANIILM